MKSLTDQLATYATYHRDRRNVATHFVGIPAIVLGIFTLLSRPGLDVVGLSLTPALLALTLSAVFYVRLDLRFGLAMTALSGLFALAGAALAAQSTLVWLLSGGLLFVGGWALQFVGHAYEGKKPAFVDDLIGLLIGPLFVVAETAFALGLARELRAEVERRAGPTRERTLVDRARAS
jgi:uncharacterized membrane protein YGL010W